MSSPPDATSLHLASPPPLLPPLHGTELALSTWRGGEGLEVWFAGPPPPHPLQPPFEAPNPCKKDTLSSTETSPQEHSATDEGHLLLLLTPPPPPPPPVTPTSSLHHSPPPPHPRTSPPSTLKQSRDLYIWPLISYATNKVPPLPALWNYECSLSHDALRPPVAKPCARHSWPGLMQEQCPPPLKKMLEFRCTKAPHSLSVTQDYWELLDY
ncbi:unnamed protein product [Gadus morhua 'NCC']